MPRRPRCKVEGCPEPCFVAAGGACLGHIRNPPAPPKRTSRRPSPPSVAEVSESSDEHPHTPMTSKESTDG